MRSERYSPTFRRALGLLGGVPLLSLSVPAAVPVAGLLALTKPADQKPPYVKRLLLAAVVGLVVLVGSATFQVVPLPMSSIGAFAVLGILIFGYAKATRDAATATQVLVWLCAGSAVSYMLFGADVRQEAIEGLWKYGIAFHVSVAVLAFTVTRMRRRFWTVLALLSLAAVSLALGFRSHAIICLMVVVLMFARGWSGKRMRAGGLIFTAAGLAALAVWVPSLIAQGVFGTELQARTLRQTEDGAPAILGGRTESPLSIAAVLERPWFGFGNSQELTATTVGHGMNIAAALGMPDPSAYIGFWVRRGGVVSLHSIFFGSWVDGGIFAAMLPAVLIGLFAVALWKAGGRLAPIVTFVSAQAIWDIMFSPWASNRSAVIAASAVLAAWAIYESQARKVEEPPGAPLHQGEVKRYLPAGDRS